ncbi:MAG: TIGR00303 family protein, partial [Cyanobacteria bacterium P01_F01_bin.42]
MIHLCTEAFLGAGWLKRYRRIRPHFFCVMGFTDTGLYPGISAAGRSIEDRKKTAIADLEFLIRGNQRQAQYPLPPLVDGASPVLITRAIAAKLKWPIIVMNAGSHIRPPYACIDLGGHPAKCLSKGNALEIRTVLSLFQTGVEWGARLAPQIEGYVILSECVVGGTTTALGVLSALGYDAATRMSSSHRVCNHPQKWRLVQQGLAHFKHYRTDS